MPIFSSSLMIPCSRKNLWKKAKPFSESIFVYPSIFSIFGPDISYAPSAATSTAYGSSLKNESAGSISGSYTVTSLGQFASRFFTSYKSSLRPLPLTADIGNTFMPCGSNSALKAEITSFSSPAMASILLAAMTCGFLRSCGLYASSSLFIALMSATGSRPSVPAASTMCIMTLVRSI